MSEYVKPSVISDTSGDVSPTGVAFPFAANAVVLANAAVAANAVWVANAYVAGNAVGTANAAVIATAAAFTNTVWASE